jgi:rSAM/selenodomain-associated transferase 1
MCEDDDRILAIMMKAARPGQVKTRLASAYSTERILAIYRALAEDTIELARRMSVRAIAFCPSGDETDLAEWLPGDLTIVPQQGAGLAAALRSVFEQLCTKSGRRVVAFNADSPHLRAGELQAAFTALAHNDLVVGPCDDGGFYLVGARRPYPRLFDASVMGHVSACAALLAEAGRQGLRVAQTAEHYDIDLPHDLVRLAHDLSEQPSRASRTAELLTTLGLINSSRGA